MRTKSTLGILAVLCIAMPLSGAAQHLSPPFPAHDATASWLTPGSPAATPPSLAGFGNPSDYRWEGVLIGGVVLGVTATIFGASYCAEDNAANRSCVWPAVGLGLAGGTVGAVVGGLVGGLIPKNRSGSGSP